MREVIASLMHVQDLELVLEESNILHRGRQPDADLKVLQSKIETLRQTVPASTLRRYDMLRRNGLAVTREEGGLCTACRLNVPKGDLNRMRNGIKEWMCPNCGRFVLLS